MVETETISFKIQSHLFFTMMKSMSKNIILIVKIVFFWKGEWCGAWKGKETKAFLLLVAILPVFLIYNTWIKAYHTKDKDGNDIIKTILFWNVLQCQPKITFNQRKLRTLRQRDFRRIFIYLPWTWSKSKWENDNGFLIYWCHNPFAIGSRIRKCWKFIGLPLQASWTSWEQQNAFINDNGMENVPRRLHIS